MHLGRRCSVWWRKALQGVLWRGTSIQRQRLNRGYGLLQRRADMRDGPELP